MALGKTRTVVMGSCFFVGCLIATFSHFRQKALFCADKAIAQIPLSCSFLDINLAPIPSARRTTIGWIVEYDIDILGPGPIQIYVSPLGNLQGANVELPVLNEKVEIHKLTTAVELDE